MQKEQAQKLSEQESKVKKVAKKKVYSTCNLDSLQGTLERCLRTIQNKKKGLQLE